MAVEPWVPGKFYAPGDLTIPTSTLLPEQSGLPNGNFESGDVEWTKQTGFTIVNGETAFQGTWSAKKSDGNPSSIINDVRAPVTPGQSIRASCMIKLGSDSSPSGGRIILRWYATGGALLSTTGGSLVNSGTGWKTSTVTGAAPSGAATVSVEVSVNKSASQPPNYVDNVSWSYTDNVAVSPKLVYKAVQPDIGKSGLIEPTWPATLGQTVVDNEVTWEAIGDTRIVWTGTPLFLSGEYEPTWPTAPGDVVADNSIGWQCVVRNVTDENCPNTRVVLIAASKIFAVDDDIIAYSATVNPLDWTTENDAGYLPTGLQQYGSNPMAAMGLYRGNLVAWNAQGAQIWQVDEDPARMALLDTLPIGCTFPKSVAPIADDLFFVTQLGIRSFGLAAGSTNLATGDVGVPIDPLVEVALRVSPTDAKGTYLPSKGQYWVWFQGMYLVGDAPDTYVGEVYSYTYTTVGGVAPYVYSLASGTLPGGLTLNASTSEISGTVADDPGEYPFTLRVVDSLGQSATLDDSIDIVSSNVYVLNSDIPGTLTVVDASDNTETETISVGDAPYRILKSPDGETLYVSNLSGNSVSVIDAATNTVTATITGFNAPSGMAINAAGTILYVANKGGTDNIVSVSTATNTITGTVITTPHNADWMALSPEEDFLYVACNAIGVRLKVVNIAGGTVDFSTAGAGNTGEIVVPATGGKLYMCSPNGLYVFENTGYTISSTVATGVCYTAKLVGSNIYVGIYDAAGSVKVVDTATDTVTDTIGSGTITLAHGVAVNASESKVYACEYDFPARLHVIDVATNTIDATVVLSTTEAFDCVVTP